MRLCVLVDGRQILLVETTTPTELLAALQGNMDYLYSVVDVYAADLAARGTEPEDSQAAQAA